MSIRLVFFLVLLCNSLVVSAALVVCIYIGDRQYSFGEKGLVTILSIFQLLVISWLSFKILQARGVMQRCSFWRDSSAVWGIISFCFLFLAADEFFQIHENTDHLIHYVFNIQETGLTDRIDDILIGIYGLTGIGVLIAYRDELKTFREALPLFTCGFVLLFISVILDALTNRNDILPVFVNHDLAAVLNLWFSVTEDALKPFAEAFFIVAFYVILHKAKRMGEGQFVRTDG